jgi:hypothetical protein
MKKNILSLLIIILISLPTAIGTSSSFSAIKDRKSATYTMDDLDPLVDLAVTVEITQIRTLEQMDLGHHPISKIDRLSDPDFYVKVFINNQEFTSPTWYNTKYVYNPNWSATADVPDDVELVNITIQLWDASPTGDRLCDISDNSGNGEAAYDITLQYDLKTGHWDGDDWLPGFWGGPDPSGYGRLNGCDDNSQYQNDRDCEMLFNIHQNDFDHDNIPYWTEVNVFKTDPTVGNTGEDFDHDGVPIEWEWKWGYSQSFDRRNYTIIPHWIYDPNIWENHTNLDPDADGLNNIEEYRMADWGADPFRKDLFVELDQMEAGRNGQPASLLPDGSKELLRTAYDKHNIVYHLDDGSHKDSGSDMIPFDNLTTADWGSSNNELQKIYNDYFLHGNPNNWRLGVFHYGVVVYQCSLANGNMFGMGSYQISSKGLNEKAASLPYLDRDIVFASAYMHECGHTLNIENPCVDDQNSKYPWELNWWKYRPYKSVMNYGYMFLMVDYSDGARGRNDFNDWNSMDLTAFETDFP